MQISFRRKARAAVLFAALCVALAGSTIFLFRIFALPPLPLGSPMPRIAAVSLENRPFAFDSASSKKRLVVFFAPACSHCRRELANLAALLPRYAGRLDIFGVSLDNGSSTKAAVAELGLNFPVVIADADSLREHYRIHILPALFCADECWLLQRFYSGEHSLAEDARLLDDFVFSSRE